MARFNMYYRALDFLYTVEKGRGKNSYRRVPLTTKQKVRSFLIWSVWKWDFKKGIPLRTSKPHGSYNFNWNFPINSPKTDVNLLRENMTYSWCSDTSHKQKWLLSYDWRSSSASSILNYIAMQLHFSICNLKRAVTVSLILLVQFFLPRTRIPVDPWLVQSGNEIP